MVCWVLRTRKEFMKSVLIYLLLTLAAMSAPAVASTDQDRFEQRRFEPAHIPERPIRLEQTIRQALDAKPSDYVPRTEHLLKDGSPRYTNRLILEDSPYLIQHAHNPVDWHSWGERAFAIAKAQNKPVMISIGYSTCHWCHVMEKLSFEHGAVADFINRNFIAIKVDREQRPDVDKMYLNALIHMTADGGWPMTGFLTPDGKPFFTGNFYRPWRFIGLLQKIAGQWADQRDELEIKAGQIAAAVDRMGRADTTSARLKQPAVDLVMIRDHVMDGLVHRGFV